MFWFLHLVLFSFSTKKAFEFVDVEECEKFLQNTLDATKGKE